MDEVETNKIKEIVITTLVGRYDIADKKPTSTKLTQMFNKYSDEVLAQIIEQAPNKPYLDETRKPIGKIISASRRKELDVEDIKAIEFYIEFL